MSAGVLAVFGLMMATLGAAVGFVLRGIFMHGGSDVPGPTPMDDAVVNVPETLRLRGLL